MIENITRNKIISLAPGRTCLFGDHQDYIGLPIIACAIDRYIKIIATENKGKILNIKKPDIGEEQVIDLTKEVFHIDKGDHLLASIKVLKRHGYIINRGFDIVISGNLPINAGTSSSSAVVIAWVKFLLKAFDNGSIITPEFVSQIAYEAEVIEQGSPGGKMDQYSIGLGNILYLETGDDLNYQLIDAPLKGLIIGESGIPKETIGVLKEMKENAWLAISKIQEKIHDFDIKDAIKKDLTMYLNHLPDYLKPFLFAAISNHDITQRALIELKKENINFAKIGKLINEHHQILRDVLKVTVPKIDNMINAALSAGAYGAKIVGSGRGGSIVVLAPIEKEQSVIDAIIKAGGKDAYRVNVDPGARIIEPKN